MLTNSFLIAAASAFLGSVLTIVTQHFLGKRGLLTYSVWHNRVGLSAEDAVFGSVKVTWNNNAVTHLYVSNIDLRNESLRDYENVAVTVYTNNTILLTERAEIVGTTRMLPWSPQFAASLFVPPGATATPAQSELVYSRREYAVPTFNRGQVVRVTLLNSAKGADIPAIWVEVLHKGIKVKFRAAVPQAFGVPLPAAALTGTILAPVVLAVIVRLVNTLWLACALAMAYGLLVLLPGFALVRAWRWLRDAVAS